MHVNRRRGDIDVPKQYLDHPRIHAAFQKPRRIAVTKRMGRDMPRDASLGSGLPDGVPQCLAGDRCATAAVGAKPAAIAVGQPKAAQFVEDRLWNWDPALFVAFADGCGTVAGCADPGYDFEGRELISASSLEERIA